MNGGDRAGIRTMPPDLAAVRRGRRRRAALAFMLAATLLAVGCGDASSGSSEAQPAPGVTSFAPGGFDELPRYPRSTSTGPRSEKAGVVTRTFAVRNATPEKITRWFNQSLEARGWDVARPPAPVGENWRGAWERDGEKVEVAAGPAPAASRDDRDELVTQYSVLYEGDGAPN